MYTLHGKIRPTRHTFSTLGPCMTLNHMYLMWFIYDNLSHSCQHIWTDLLPWERLPTQSTAHRLTDSWVRIQLLSHNSQWSNEKKSSFYWQPTPRLTGPINTSMGLVRSILTRRVNSSVLNQHRRGLQPWRCQLSTYHSSTFLTDGLHFPPKGPARFPV
jgi:hypothetical protein